MQNTENMKTEKKKWKKRWVRNNTTPWQEGRGGGAETTDRLTQQWGVERVVLLVAVGTQDTFDLHIRGHEWGRGHLR